MNEEIQFKLQQFIDEFYHLNKRQPTMAELNEHLSRLVEALNNAPKKMFDGLSSSQIQLLFSNFLDDGCCLQLKNVTEEVALEVPIYRQTRRLIEILKQDKEIKLTQTGRLPVKIVKELFELGEKSYWEKQSYFKVTSEGDVGTIILLRAVLRAAKIIHVLKGKLLLTKNASPLSMDTTKLLKIIIQILCTRINIAVADDYQNKEMGVEGIGYTLALLAKYGDKPHDFNFYTQKYITAFPRAVMSIEEDTFLGEEKFVVIYKHRTFSRIISNLGIVDWDTNSHFREEGIVKIVKTPLFDKLFTFTV
jgi:hypothetical protein